MFTRSNPLLVASKHQDDEDFGENIHQNSVAGGGCAERLTNLSKTQLRVSKALRSFLVHHDIIPQTQVSDEADEPSGALLDLLDKPHIKVPPELTDRSHPLTEYLISSSHNTYLLAHQLYGTSATSAYETALSAGARCVEIDAWDDETDLDEPKVTHGYTLVSHVAFRAVCETIRDVVDREAIQSTNEGRRAAPIFLSLENHCAAHGQHRLVTIMKDTWGDRLVSTDIRKVGHEEASEHDGVAPVHLHELGSKICVIVEYHFPHTQQDNYSDTESSSDNKDKNTARQAYNEKKRGAPAALIIPELAELGVYVQSVKPRDNSWYEEDELREIPHHHLINVSETQLLSHMPAYSDKIAKHNAKHLMRVYPKGTRISSTNMSVVPFWGIGAQICALNWQTFGVSMQLNEALFSGTDGYVLKPASLRAGGNGKLSTGQRKKLSLHIAGATDVPSPSGRQIDDIKPYVTCTLIHPDNLTGNPVKRKTVGYKQHRLALLHHGDNPPTNEPIWDETLEWEFEDNEFTFLRILIKSDDSFATNVKLLATAVRLLYVMPGWCFIRMFDLSGRQTRSSLLVKFQLEDL